MSAGVLLAFSLVLGMISETFVLDAHPREKVSLWGNAERELTRVRLIRGVAAGLAIMGAAELTDSIGYWSVLLIVAVMFAPLVLRLRHNRSASAAL